jgi:hypothetical protein
VYVPDVIKNSFINVTFHISCCFKLVVVSLFWSQRINTSAQLETSHIHKTECNFPFYDVLSAM